MKKRLVFFVAVMLLLSLFGCTEKPPVTSTPMTSTPSTTTPSTNTTAGSNPGGDVTQPGVLDVDLSELWEKPDIEAAYCAAFSEEGYYYLDNRVLNFMDTSNGISVVLCQKIGCEHKKEDCEAHLAMCYVMFYTDGYIYYNKFDLSDPYGVTLYRRKADGTAEEKVATLGGEYVSKDISVQIGEFLAADGSLYYTLYTLEAVKKDENDPGEILERDGILVRLDLNTGKQQELLRDRDVLIRLFGARGNALLFHVFDKPPAEEIMDPDYYEKWANMYGRLNIWSATGGTVTLFEKKQKDCSWILGFHGGNVYYYDDKNVFTYNLAQDKHTVMDLPYGFQLVSENYIITDYQWVDLQTGQTIDREFVGAEMAVKNRTERGCILEFRYNGEPCIDEYGQIVIPRLRTILGYIAYDALADGLQESDLLVIRDVEGK